MLNFIFSIAHHEEISLAKFIRYSSQTYIEDTLQRYTSKDVKFKSIYLLFYLNITYTKIFQLHASKFTVCQTAFEYTYTKILL